jgi:hypothetical protein
VPPGKDGINGDNANQDQARRPLDEVGGVDQRGVDDDENPQGQDDALAQQGKPSAERRPVIV